MLDTKKAERQLKKFKKKINFNYEVGYFSVMDFTSFAIEIDGYSLENILLSLREGEVIKFLLNDGFKYNNKYKQTYNFLKETKYSGSIYWENEYYGDTIRIKSNYPDFVENIHNNAKLVIRRNKLNKIKKNIWKKVH